MTGELQASWTMKELASFLKANPLGIDVYKGEVPVQKNFINFGTYVTMFPQLIAGPIVRYADMMEKLKL